MIRYGNPDCEHLWRLRKDGHEEYCIGVVCVKCGAFGCGCDAEADGQKIDMDNGLNGNENPDGKWKNPYC